MRELILLIIIVFSCSFIEDGSDCLSWSAERKLKWPDLQGAKPENAQMAANTSSIVRYSLRLMRDSFEISIGACLQKDHSWFNPEDTTALLLNHEQRHWDIAEIHARKFRQYVEKWNRKDFIKEYLQKGIQMIDDSLSSMQSIYDTETIHGLRGPKQVEWNGKIDSLLNMYSAYQRVEIKVAK